jgi:peptide/nickel transport system ATP-binding protein
MNMELGHKALTPIQVMSPLLEVQDLEVAYSSHEAETVTALAGVSFSLGQGEILGVLGESGSGKSTLAAALLRLLPPNGKICGGAVRFEGRDLLQSDPQELERFRGGRIAIIFQEPSMALHPTIRVGDQISDVTAAHERLSRSALRERTRYVLASVFPSDAKRIAESYPHQLSGGQRQRVLLAQAIACGPALVIADEPTASLDHSTQQEILALFRTLQRKLGLAIILITHNPAVLTGLADRVLVLYAGRVAEIGLTEQVLASPQHPYTRALLGCMPPPFAGASLMHKTKLRVIGGDSPNLTRLARGCRFEPRCADRMDVCTAKEPPEIMVSTSHGVSCFKYGG